MQQIRDNLDSFISPSQRRTYEREVQKRQKALEAEQAKLQAEAARDAAERLEDQRVKRARVFLGCLITLSLLAGMWFARHWLVSLLIIAGVSTIGIFAYRFFARKLRRRKAAKLCESISVTKEGLYYDSRLTPWESIWNVSSNEDSIVIKIKSINHQTKSVGMSEYLRIDTPPTFDAQALLKRIVATQTKRTPRANLKGYRFKK